METCQGQEPSIPNAFASSAAEGTLPSPACGVSCQGVTFPLGCSCTPTPPPSLRHFPGHHALCLQPRTFLQRNFSFFFFFQKNHQVIKFNLRTCRELLMRKCLAISPQPACRNVLLWLVFIGMDVSGVCNLGTLDVNSLESKGSYCREGCSWDQKSKPKRQQTDPPLSLFSGTTKYFMQGSHLTPWVEHLGLCNAGENDPT